MKKLKLSQGFFAIAPNDWPSNIKYSAFVKGRRVYAMRNVFISGQWKRSLLHREILGLEFGDKRQVDHIDGNGLNNVRSNLRIVFSAENQRAKMRKRIGASSLFRGVTWDKERQKWQAKVFKYGKTYFVGRFIDEVSAAKARDKKALELFGPIAHLNFYE